jgi:hypothetical protein
MRQEGGKVMKSFKYSWFAGLLVLVFVGATQFAAAQGNANFQFWYEKWNANESIKKLPASNILVGLQPAGLKEVHAAGKKALQYVTYYQAQPGSVAMPTLADLPSVGFQLNGTYLPSRFGGKDKYALCDNAKAMRERAIKEMTDIIVNQGYDGLFVDNTSLDPTNHAVCQASHAHVGPSMRGDDAFLALLAEVRDKLHQLKPDAVIMTNPFDANNADGQGTGGRSLWDLSDYVLWEAFGWTAVYQQPAHSNYSRTFLQQALRTADNPSKAPKVVALSYPTSLQEAIFSYALAKILGFHWTANTGDHQVGVAANGGFWGNFINQVPLELGAPNGGRDGSLDNPVFHRRFQRGEAFANASQKPVSVSVPAGVTLYTGAQAQSISAPTKINLAPGNGAVWIR